MGDQKKIIAILAIERALAENIRLYDLEENKPARIQYNIIIIIIFWLYIYTL